MLFTTKLVQIITTGVFTLVITTGAVANEHDSSLTEKAMTSAFDAMDKDFVVVDFASGQVVLTELQKEKLKALVNSSDVDKQRLQVIVSAWSDKSFPVENAADQTGNDRQLAQQRLDVIRSFLLTNNSDLTIDSHNMAKRTGVIGRLFNTQDAKLKESVAGQPVSDPNMAKAAEVLRDNGGPSRAVVMLNLAH